MSEVAAFTIGLAVGAVAIGEVLAWRSRKLRDYLLDQLDLERLEHARTKRSIRSTHA